MAMGQCGRLSAACAVLLAVAGCAPLAEVLPEYGAAVPTADPQALIGLSSQEIGEVLGAPELQRQEPPAEVWQYRSAACVFDLYLYPEGDSTRAVHYEARSRSNGTVDPAQCLGSLVARLPAATTAPSVSPARL